MSAPRAVGLPRADIEGFQKLQADLRLASRITAETLTLLETLLSKAPFGFGFVDRNFRVVRMNETLAAVNGSTVAEQLGQTVASIVPQYWPQIEPLYRRVLESGESVLDVEVSGPSSGDPVDVRHWLTSYYPVSLGDEIIGIGIIVVDITERKTSEAALRLQADLLDAAGQAIIATDTTGDVIYWNSAAESLYGWPRADAMGRNIGDLITTGGTREGRDAILQCLARGQISSCDYWVKHRDGTRFPVYVTNSPVFGRDGQVVAVIGVSVDVTERRAGEDARRQLAAIVDGSGDAIFGSTTKGTVTSWNAAAEQLLEYTADDIIGQSVTVLMPAGTKDGWAAVRTRLIAGGPAERVETTLRSKSGNVVEVLAIGSPVVDEAGVIVGLSMISHDITEGRNTQRALEASLRLLGEAQRVAHFGSAEYDPISGVLTRSDEYCRILGVDPAAEISSEHVISLIHPDDRAAAAQMWADALRHGATIDTVCRVVRPDSVRWVRFGIVPEIDDEGVVVKLMGTLHDETDRVEVERVRRAAETHFEIGFEQTAFGAAIVDLDGLPLRVNPALCALLGRPAELLVGRRWNEFTHPEDIPLRQAVAARVTSGHDTCEDERRYVWPDGTIVWASSHVTLVRDEMGKPDYFLLHLQDITERKHMEQELAHQALHDTLTGLPNRALLTDRLVLSLAGSRRRGSQLAVMFLDVDHFKAVNDSLGHGCGDELLRKVAERIAGAIRPGDTVARFGGDEFVVVCDDVSVAETEEIAARVMAAVRRPCRIGGQDMTISASVGIAIGARGATPESLLRDSDAAMYQAKERGRDRIELFGEALRSKSARRFATAAALHRALDRNEFTVHYQPVVDLCTGAMVSAEALLRWEHPDRGLVGPDEFIPLAEESGLIVPIGAWVLEQACQRLTEWQRTDPSMTVAVNLSVRQLLAPDLVGLIAEVLTRTGARPADLCLELTESVFMKDVEYFETALTSLKALGVRLSIDDFGTGYSSLSYLKQFTFDAVKVDRTFVDGLGTDSHDTALVAAIIAMAAALELEVTAEGVETKDQLANLKRLHCPRAQGFYLARPMPLAAMNELVAESHRWSVD